jgi:hypothetical protein
MRDNIHTLDESMSESLIDMLNSDDSGDVRLALEIINNVDLNEGKNAEYISHIVHSTDFTFIDADTEAGIFSVSHLVLFKGDDLKKYK